MAKLGEREKKVTGHERSWQSTEVGNNPNSWFSVLFVPNKKYESFEWRRQENDIYTRPSLNGPRFKVTVHAFEILFIKVCLFTLCVCDSIFPTLRDSGS